ncbi:helix-turn-helix transcriptional regulator [Sphingomonas faeni]|uniref:helix-turn-helix transcriptional regulator n=1 Tax=Sphingomonas faeni TaxID=185950 RepID=UPI0020C7DF6E|nr:AlpA family phage regulatory protein [Sphingomonas faeni]MCP8891288.1 AlpA family phage regulatory protein [Sphingomonas faeni]
MNMISTELSRRNLAAAKLDGRPSDSGRFLRINDVIATVGLSRATIYRLIDAGDFPTSTALTKRCVGWWEGEVCDWVNARRAGSPRTQ